MATYYLDYEGGNDASAGTSFATRWKTITSGATAARIAPGDVVRVMASPNATNTGINATWTADSSTVTLASSLTQLLYNDGAWTASANVTSTAGTTIRKLGSNSCNLVIAAGFTTGLVAYYDIGSTVDLSGYQQISFWIKTSVSSASSQFEIKLCSDTVGAVALTTLTVPALIGTNMQVITIDNGANLSSLVRSIALYATADPGAVTIVIDNIIACKASSSVDSLTLGSLISKGTGSEPYYAIRSINGTSVELDTLTTVYLPSVGCKYSGTTETVALYKRETTKTDRTTVITTVIQDVMDSGSSGSLITFSGGWNRTDMSTQSGETYFDGMNCFGIGLRISARNYINLEKLSFVRYGTGVQLTGAVTGCIFNIPQCCNNATTGIDIATTSVITNVFSDINALNGNLTGLTHNGYRCTFLNINKVDSNTAANITIVSAKSSIFNNINSLNYAGTIGISMTSTSASSNTFNSILSIKSSGTIAISIGNSNNIFKNISITSSIGNNISFASGATNNKFYNCYLGAAGSGTGVGLADGNNYFFNCDNLSTSETSGQTVGSSGRTVLVKNDRTVNAHKIVIDNLSILSDASVVESPSSFSWKITDIGTYTDQYYPFTLPVAKIAVCANALVTASIRMRRTSTNVTCGLRCLGSQIAGVPSDVSTNLTAAIDTWASVQITFTPTEAGVVELECYSYSNVVSFTYIGPITVSQA